MELRHLRYFLAVAEEQNVTRAAARLRIAQPALSRQIRDLEHDLGVALFERGPASLRLTEGGRLFLNETRSVLRRVEEAVHRLRSTAAAKRAELHLGYAPSPTAPFLPRLLRDFEAKAPEVRLSLHDMTSDEMLAGLRAKKLHAALMVEQLPRRTRGLIFEKIRSYRIGIAAPKDHRLAARRKVAPGEVLAERLVVFSKKDYPDYHCWLGNLLQVNARKLQVSQECDGALSLVAAVEAGRGVAVSGESIVSIAGARVVFVPFKPAPAPIIVGICYDPRSLATSPVSRLVEVVRSTLQV